MADDKIVIINFQAPESLKLMASDKAKAQDLTVAQFLRKLIREAK